MADDNKPMKYARYAFGEIILVVIGILIALSINNWNSANSEKTNIYNYYEKITDEIELISQDINFVHKTLDTLILQNKRSLDILNLKNKDSIVKLNETIGALGTAFRGDFTFPILEEFLEQGHLSKIKNDSIKYGFLAFKIANNELRKIDNYLDQQYSTSIEPYFYTNINYSQVAYGSIQNELIKGGPETDYSKFVNNLEIYNLITFKLETLISQRHRLEFMERSLAFVQKQIALELEK